MRVKHKKKSAEEKSEWVFRRRRERRRTKDSQDSSTSGKATDLCSKWLVVEYNNGEEGMTGSFALDVWRNSVLFTKQFPNGCTKTYTAKCEDGVVEVKEVCRSGDPTFDNRWIMTWFGGRRSTVHPGEVIFMNTDLGMKVNSSFGNGLEFHAGYVKWKATSEKPTTTSMELAKIGKLADTSVESLAWMNVIIDRMWPKLDKAIWHYIETTVNPQLANMQLPYIHASMEITEFTLGQPPMKLGPFKTFSTQSGVKLHTHFEYLSSKPVKLKVGMIPIEVRSWGISGELVTHLTPLIEELPVIGGQLMYFVNAPKIDINFAQAAGILDAPGIHGLVRGAINKVVAKLAVLPNVIGKPIGTVKQGVDPAQFERPKLLAVLRVTAKSASNLVGKDHHLFSSPTSDPYVAVTVADHRWQTRTVKNSLNPGWQDDNVQEFAVYDTEQSMIVDVWDDDSMTHDDLIGRVEPIKVSEAQLKSDLPLPLVNEGASSGTVTLGLQWLDIVPPTTRGLDRTVVEFRVRELLIPAAVGQAGITATISGITQSSLLGKKRETPKVDAVITGVVKNARSKSMSDADIAAITGLTMEQLAEMSDVESEGFIEMDIHDYLNFFPKMIYKGDKITMSVTDKKGKVIGTSDFLLDDVASAPGLSKRGWADFGGGIKAELSVSLLGLKARSSRE